MDELPQPAMETLRQKEELTRKLNRQKELEELVDFVFWRVFSKLVVIQVIMLAICGLGFAIVLALT